MMKSIALAFVSAFALVAAHLELSNDVLFCNCPPPVKDTYDMYKQSEGSCSHLPRGLGFGACVATMMGLLSEDGRSVHNETFATLPYPEVVNGCLPMDSFPSLDQMAAPLFQWQGSFDYVGMNQKFEDFFDCFGTGAVTACTGQIMTNLQQCVGPEM